MSRSYFRLGVWGAVLAAVAVFANSPQNAGTLKRDIWHAGFPFIFARWVGDVLDFHPISLVLNVLIWVSIGTCVLFLLAVTNRRLIPK
jgi:hypothetical protein